MNKGKWRGEAVFLTVATAAGAFLRFYRIGKECLWFDEVCSAGRASMNLVRLIDNLTRTTLFPPLYFILLRVWAMVAGTGPVSLRSFSAAWGAAAVPLVYLLAREMFGRRAAVVAAILLVLSSFNIYYSQEAKMYTMWWTLVLLSSFFFIRAVKHGARRADLWPYVLATAAALWTHNFTLLVMIPHLFYLLLLRRPRGPARNWIISYLLIFILYLPWPLAVLAMNLTSPVAGGGLGGAVALTKTATLWIPVPTIADFSLAFVIFTSGLCFYAFDLETWRSAWHMPFPNAQYLCLLALAIILSPSFLERGTCDRWRFPRLIALLILFPLVSAFAYSWLVMPVWQPRYMGFVSALLFIAMGYGYDRSARRLLSFAALVLVAFLNLSVLGFYYTDRVKKPWDDLVAYVAPRLGENPVILFPGVAARESFYYYWNLDRDRMRKRGKLQLEFPYKHSDSIRERVADSDDVWLVLNYALPQPLGWRERVWIDVSGLRAEKNCFGSGHLLMHYAYRIDVPGYRRERMHFGSGLEVIRYLREEPE